MRRGPNTAYSSVWQTSACFVIRLCWVCIYVEKHEHYRRLCMVSTRPFGVGEHVVAISLFHGSVSECSIGCGSESQFCSCCADWLCRIILIVCLTDRFVVDFFAFRSLSASPSSESVIQGMGSGGGGGHSFGWVKPWTEVPTQQLKKRVFAIVQKKRAENLFYV